MPDEAAHVDGILTYGSAADERTVKRRGRRPLGPSSSSISTHYTRTNDLEIGGFVLTPELRAEAAASADPATRQLAELRDRLPNSASETSEFAAGFAWIDGDNNAGLSLSRYDSLYGVPVRYSLVPAVDAERVRLDLKQTRLDGRAEIEPATAIDSLRFRGSYSEYRHFSSRTRRIATTFEPRRGARLEAIQSHGRLGRRLRRAISTRPQRLRRGEISSANHTSQLGLFTLQTLNLPEVRRSRFPRA